jgi:glycosyltransferase involved in cell wall biosynthesis
LKIALWSDWFLPRLGGLELQLRDLATELAARGHEIHVITTTPADPARQGRLQTAQVTLPDAVTVHRLDVPLVPGLHASVSRRLAPAARDVLARVMPDVVHGHASIGSTAVLAGGWAAHSLGVPNVVTFHSVLGAFRHILKAVDLAVGWSRWPGEVAAVSEVVAREVRWMLPGRAVHVLGNGVDPAWWRVGTPADPRQPELRVITVMRLQPRKRGRALLGVLASARQRTPGPVHLTVVGDGPARGALEATARRLGLADAVTFTGTRSREEIRCLFGGAHVFLQTSVQESFGLAALEARSAGLAVVARADSGVGDLFHHGREGLFARADAGVADELARLGGDRSLLARIMAHNRTVLPDVCWERTVSRHLRLYERARSG